LKNTVKEMLRSGKTALVVWLSIMWPDAIQTIRNAGFDWVLFDTEHGPPSIETVNRMIQITDGRAIPLIRVVWNDINAIKKALDTGAFGVVVPWVSNKADAVNAVRYSRYPPGGLRGVAPGRAARAWGVTPNEYLEIVNDEIMVIVQIEREEAIENIEGIVSVEGVDATLIGPMDLSASMGLRGKPFHPKVVKAMEKVVEECKSAGVAPGIAFAESIDHIGKLMDRGFQFIGVGEDISLLLKGCEDTLKQIEATRKF